MSGLHQGSDDREDFDSESPRALASIPEEPARSIRSRSVARPPPRRGQITTVACSPCQQRKTKCDGRRPVCGPCSKSESIKSCNWELPRGQKRSVFLRSQVTKFEEENENLRRLIVQTLQNNIAARTRASGDIRREVEACVQDGYEDVMNCLHRIEAAKAAESNGHKQSQIAFKEEHEDPTTRQSPSESEILYGLPGTTAVRYGEEVVEAPATWLPTVYHHHNPHPHHFFTHPRSAQAQTDSETYYRSTYVSMTHPTPANASSDSSYSQCLPERELPRGYYQQCGTREMLVSPEPPRMMGAEQLSCQPIAYNCSDWIGQSSLPSNTASMIATPSNYMHMSNATMPGPMPVLATSMPWSAENGTFVHGTAGMATHMEAQTSWGYDEYHSNHFMPENPPSYESTPSAWSPHTPDSSIWTKSETCCNPMTVPDSRPWVPGDQQGFQYDTRSNTEPYLHGHEGSLDFGAGLRSGLYI